MKKSKIVITYWEFSNKATLNLEDIYQDDIELFNAIQEFKTKKLPSEEEVFKENHNIIITEKQCYGAFWEHDLKKTKND